MDVPGDAPIVRVLLLNEQAGAGVPPVIALQERLTLPVYPFAGVTVIVEEDEPPAVIEAGDKAAALSV
jgi:hypothetical protein